jgi:hypothetical protein
LGTAFVVYLNVPELPGALHAIGVKNLKPVVVPGSADIFFPQKGAYAVYYEYRSVIDGVSYTRNEYPPIMLCQLRSKNSGRNVRLEPSQVKGNVYTTSNPTRAGVMYKMISIDQPGTYTFSCQYPDGRAVPRSIMAVGPNFVWEFFNLAAKPLAAFLCGAYVFLAASSVSILIIGIVAYKRYRAKNALSMRE